MKSRSGFVSNSSTSSFIFVGAFISKEYIKAYKTVRPVAPSFQANASSEDIAKFKTELEAYEKTLKLWETSKGLETLLEDANLELWDDSEYDDGNKLVGICMDRSYSEGENMNTDIESVVQSQKDIQKVFKKFGIKEKIDIHVVTQYC